MIDIARNDLVGEEFTTLVCWSLQQTGNPWGTAHAGQDRHVGIEPILQILEQLGLVTFHRPQIVAACLADLDGDLSLGVQGIANDHFIA